MVLEQTSRGTFNTCDYNFADLLPADQGKFGAWDRVAKFISDCGQIDWDRFPQISEGGCIREMGKYDPVLYL